MKILYTVLIVITSITAAFSQVGRLDPAFGQNGIILQTYDPNVSVLTKNANFEVPVTQILLPEGGAIIALEITRVYFQTNADTVTCIVLTKIMKNGQRDPAFGTNSFSPPVNMQLSSADRQADGKILVAGTTRLAGLSEFIIARYNSDGSFDSTFGNRGILVSRTEYPYNYTGKIRSLSDGKFIIGGTSLFAESRGRFVLQKYNLNGTPDSSFGTNGRFIHDPGFSVAVTDLLEQPDGKILTLSNTLDDSNYDVILARFHSNGNLDSGFNGKGYTIMDSSVNMANGSVLRLLPDGKILVGGDIAANLSVVARFLPNGQIDNSFGSAGFYYDNQMQTIKSIAFQSGGKIIVGGGMDVGDFRNRPDFAMLRLNSNGTLDISFATSGRAPRPNRPSRMFGRSGNELIDVGTNSTDSIYAVSIWDRSYYSDFVAYRFSPAGLIDNSYGVTLDNDFGDYYPEQAVTFEFTFFPPAANHFVVYGSHTSSSTQGAPVDAGGLFFRYDTSGNLISYYDGGYPLLYTDFGTNEVTAFIPGDSAGRYFVAYELFNAPLNTTYIKLHRYNANKTIDSSFVETIFPTGPNRRLKPSNMAFASDGRIIVAGKVFTDSAFVCVALPNGGVDTGFNHKGSITAYVPIIRGHNQIPRIGNDGKIYVAFSTTSGKVMLARLLPNGILDSSFGTSGVATVNAHPEVLVIDLHVLENGSVIVNTKEGDYNAPHKLYRFTANGARDNNFGNNGTLQATGNLAVVQPDGKVLSVGQFLNERNNTDIFVTRQLTDGSTDELFGYNGFITTAVSLGNDIPKSIRLEKDRLYLFGYAFKPVATGIIARFIIDDIQNNMLLVQRAAIRKAIDFRR